MRSTKGRQAANKKLASVPPFRGFKMGQFRSASDQKNTKNKIVKRFPFLGGLNAHLSQLLEPTLLSFLFLVPSNPRSVNRRRWRVSVWFLVDAGIPDRGFG